MNAKRFFTGFAFACLIAGCAGSIPPPPELDYARQAYARASVCPVVKLVPVNLYKAREALVRAEQSFRDNPRSDRTRVLANIAAREARLAQEFAPIPSDSTIESPMGQKLPVGGN